MKKVYSKLFILYAILLFVSCKSKTKFDINEFKNRAERKVDTYQVGKGLAIEDKILSPPNEIIAYINKMDSTDKYVSYILTEKEKDLFLTYFRLLPVQYQDIINKKVLAVYFIKNLLGGGMSDLAYDENGEIYNILYFNSDVLDFSLSEWITLRDNSSFEKNENINIESICSENYQGLLHILFHEASHIYDYQYHITPFVFDPIQARNKSIQTAFTENIWKYNILPVKKYNYLTNTKFSGWGLSGKIDKSLALDLYKKIAKTPFSSLYGSTSCAEDFAESFTWWYLKEYFGIEYTVNVYKNSIKIVDYIPSNNLLVRERYSQFSEFKPVIKDN